MYPAVTIGSARQLGNDLVLLPHTIKSFQRDRLVIHPTILSKMTRTYEDPDMFKPSNEGGRIRPASSQ